MDRRCVTCCFEDLPSNLGNQENNLTFDTWNEAWEGVSDDELGETWRPAVVGAGLVVVSYVLNASLAVVGIAVAIGVGVVVGEGYAIGR